MFAELPGRYLFDCRSSCALAGSPARGQPNYVVTQQ